MKKFKCSRLTDLLPKEEIGKLLNKLGIEQHQCHMNSYYLGNWIERHIDVGYVYIVSCTFTDEDGNPMIHFPHNVIKVGDKYYDPTRELNAINNKNYDFDEEEEFCVVCEYDLNQYFNICRPFESWITPFEFQYKDGKIVRYEGMKEIEVDTTNVQGEYNKLIEYIKSL